MMQSSSNMMNPLVSWIPYHASASYHVICATRGILRFETLIYLTDQGICKKAIPIHCREGMRNRFTLGAYSTVSPNCEVLMQTGRISFLSTCLVFPSYFSAALRTPRIWTLLGRILLFHLATGDKCHFLLHLLPKRIFNLLPHDRIFI